MTSPRPEHRDLGAPLVGLLVEFAGALRGAGLTVGTGDVTACSAALATLEPADLLDVYWACRTSLVTRRADIDTFDEAFTAFFLGSRGTEPSPPPALTPARSSASLAVAADEGSEDEREAEQTMLGLVASGVEALKRRSFAGCSSEELAALRRIMATLRLTPPRRRTRRTVAARAGARPDTRRIVRQSLRRGGEPIELYWRGRRRKPRPLVLILDISGSMADYSRALLQFAYSAGRATTRVEVFCFGTRLTYLTRSLRTRRVDEALARAGTAAVDWEGGTRIGESLETFVRRWARRGLGRGAIVVICSDGLDRGDPQTLAAAMERLSRLCHRVVWLHPHMGNDPHFRPSSVGMAAAADYIDELLPGHDLRSLEKFAGRLPTLG